MSEVARRLPHLGGRGEYEVVGSHFGYTAVSLELLRRYSKLDTFQRSVLILAKCLVRSDDGSFHVPHPRQLTSPPEPCKLGQRLKHDVINELVTRYEAGEPSTALAAAL